MAGVLLDVLRQANDEAGSIVPYQEFYNQVQGSSEVPVLYTFTPVTCRCRWRLKMLVLAG